MRFELNANSAATGAFSANGGQVEADLILRAADGAEKIVGETARLGMRRKDATVVRLEGEDAENLAALAVRGF